MSTHPQAENIVVVGSDTRNGQGPGYWSGFVTDQSDTLMIIHIPADRKWAEVMSVPRDSYVNIPACKMGDGQLSSPTQFKINEAFAIGNLDGNHTALGAACTIKTVEQDTVPELLRLLRDTVIPPPRRDRPHRLHWSAWRRRHQHRARQAHQRWNAYAETPP